MEANLRRQRSQRRLRQCPHPCRRPSHSFEHLSLQGGALRVTHVCKHPGFRIQGVIELKIVFSLVLLVVLGAGVYVFRKRDKLFAHKHDASDSYASSNLRMWMVLLVWIHAVVILIAMIYRV